ncbi:MAG: hypothetical protein MUF86_15415 [Akkermansiaceae bacterium]|jgi:hypothetical protein|nr:hypothetical protein [Akkermansiaceae bacterium]
MKTMLAACFLPLALFGQESAYEVPKFKIASREQLDAAAERAQKELDAINARIAAVNPPSAVAPVAKAPRVEAVLVQPSPPKEPLPSDYFKPVVVPKPEPESYKSTSQLIEEERKRADQARLDLALTKEQLQKNFDDGCDQASALAESRSKMNPRPPIPQVYNEGREIIRNLCIEGKITWPQLVAFNKEFYTYVMRLYYPLPPAPPPIVIASRPQLPPSRPDAEEDFSLEIAAQQAQIQKMQQQQEAELHALRIQMQNMEQQRIMEQRRIERDRVERFMENSRNSRHLR